MRRWLIAAASVLLGCAAPPPRSTAVDPRPAVPVDAPRTAESVVQAQLDAYNRHDADAFAATYADDVVVRTGNGKILVQGKAALHERYAGVFAKYPKLNCKIAERKLEGDHVVLDHEIITGRTDRPDPWDAGWIRYEVDGGLIRAVQLP